MINRFLVFVNLTILCANASAEVITCTFKQPGQFMSKLVWNEEKEIITTTIGKNREVRTYDKDDEIEVVTGLEPYGTEGFTLVVFGDVPAIHIKLTKRATLPQDKCTVYPYEAYWGNIPGRLEESNFIEGWFMGDFGPQGVCESDLMRARKKTNCRGNGGDHDKGPKQDKSNCDKKGNGGKNK